MNLMKTPPSEGLKGGTDLVDGVDGGASGPGVKPLALLEPTRRPLPAYVHHAARGAVHPGVGHGPARGVFQPGVGHGSARGPHHPAVQHPGGRLLPLQEAAG